jgi:hypothetical protein
MSESAPLSAQDLQPTQQDGAPFSFLGGMRTSTQERPETRHTPGMLPGPDEALEALRMGEEDVRAERGATAEEVIEELERILAE